MGFVIQLYQAHSSSVSGKTDYFISVKHNFFFSFFFNMLPPPILPQRPCNESIYKTKIIQNRKFH